MQTILIIILIVLILCVIGFTIYKKSAQKSNALRKKSDIERNYLNTLKTKQTKEQRITFIKQCNSELSRNIFFTKQEADQLIQRLINS